MFWSVTLWCVIIAFVAYSFFTATDKFAIDRSEEEFNRFFVDTEHDAHVKAYYAHVRQVATEVCAAYDTAEPQAIGLLN